MARGPWIEIEAHVDASWPALVVQEEAGWRLRWSGAGNNDRPNSASPLTRYVSPGDGLVTGQSIAVAERFYRERDQPPLFQVVDHPSFEQLAGALAIRGYRAVSPSVVYHAPCAAVLATIAGDATDARVTVSDTLPDSWLGVWADAVDSAPRGVAQLAASLAAVRHRQVFVTVLQGSEEAAVGRACIDGGLVGVFNLATAPRFRGRRLVSAVLRHLVSAGARSGATDTYLQVDGDNVAARRVYDRAGYRVRYRYHYLRGAAAGATATTGDDGGPA